MENTNEQTQSVADAEETSKVKRVKTTESAVGTAGSLTNLDELRKYIESDNSLREIQKRVEVSLEDDPGHDLHHCQRVALWTIRLNPKGKTKNAVAAALLHDIVNLPKNSPERHLASEYSAEKARTILVELNDRDFTEGDIDDICLAVRDHSFSRGATPAKDLGKALQDADRLEALGVLGAFRNISCGTQMHAKFFHPTDPWGKNRQLNDKAYSMDHYQLKLFQLVGRMNTEEGKKEGQRRSDRMTRMLMELGEEIGSSYSG